MPIIDFIIPTYDRKQELLSMLASLNAQTANNWKATIVIDDVQNEKNKKTEELIESFNNPNFRYFFTGQRFNNWGHSPREMGKQASGCDYICLNGDDNYLMPTLIEEINKVIEKDDADFIYWDMVHSHYGYTYFKTFPRLNQIDMGAFCFKAALGKQVRLGNAYAADGLFVNSFMAMFPNCKVVKIEKILFVHN